MHSLKQWKRVINNTLKPDGTMKHGLRQPVNDSQHGAHFVKSFKNNQNPRNKLLLLLLIEGNNTVKPKIRILAVKKFSKIRILAVQKVGKINI